MAEPATSHSYKLGLNQVGYATLVVSIFFIILSIVAVGLRIGTRRMLGNRLGLDDWLAMISVIVFICFCSDVLVGVYTYGGGQIYADRFEAQKKLVQYMKSEYAIPPLYGINVTLVKMSILCFYHRLFSVIAFRRINYGVGIFCLVWFAAAFIGDLLYCIPIRQFWDPTAGGHCFNFANYFLVMELIDISLDVVIIALPLKTISGLQLSLRKKLALLGVFLLGAFVIVTGAVRIAYVYRPGDQLLSLAQASLWSVINLGVAILCSCLPIYRPWLPKFGNLPSILRSRYGKSSQRDSSHLPSSNPGTSTTTKSYLSRSMYYHQMNDSHGDVLPLTQIAVDDRQVPGEPFQGIRVQRDVEVA
ncbi:hypothetical protein N7468_000007 [Penicillium chermesinum]|uniref:Rhodopsin domain-containing protein n=1 Tax=Penicillium chermesinum TaxID=63820 RepID=A0A9W9U013_9EURO|nr:uncharacterized protein N7468_000007 [Penicillium chermesinum]KAJ5248556.1 hypothetical protein N7468_000007 [Penicillium chermesinum]KAJ6150671.1 hypothetical protein N7470_007265 [Penicillium chermesinum]